MRDVRFVSGDSEALILETSDGEKLRLTVDDTIRDATRKSAPGSSNNNLSPRDIQDAIRGGASVEDLAASSGDSIDFIKRFAAPVLEELAHMVASALAVRVEISPDRYNEARHQEFGALVAERLANAGATELTWQASRTSATTWLVSVLYQTASGSGTATWTFDPRHVVLSPENETAVKLSNSAMMGEAVIPKLLSVGSPTTSVANEEPEIDERKVTDLLDAFKQRREAAAAGEPVPNNEAIDVPSVEREPFASAPEEVEEPKNDAPKKGRAPMPSWDEIVFGSKSDSED